MTNGSAIGYALMAYKRMNPKATREQFREFEAIMNGIMDLTDEEEAYEVYRRN